MYMHVCIHIHASVYDVYCMGYVFITFSITLVFAQIIKVGMSLKQFEQYRQKQNQSKFTCWWGCSLRL